MARVFQTDGSHHKAKPASSSKVHRQNLKVPGVAKSQRTKFTESTKRTTPGVLTKEADTSTGKKKRRKTSKKPRSHKRKSREDSNDRNEAGEKESETGISTPGITTDKLGSTNRVSQEDGNVSSEENGTGKQKVDESINTAKKSRLQKRKAQEDSIADEEEQDARDDEVAERPPQSKKAKANSTSSLPAKSTELPPAPPLVETSIDGLFSKDAARLQANILIMEGPEKLEYEALFRKMLEAKELIGKLGDAQAKRNKRLGELAKNARAKANAGKPAWVKKA